MRSFAGKPFDKLDIDPLMDGAKVPHHGVRQITCSVGYFGCRIHRATEQRHVHAMWRKPGIRIDCPLGCEQRWWRDEYQIGAPGEFPVALGDQCGVDTGVGGIIVDAIVDAEILPESLGKNSRMRHNKPGKVPGVAQHTHAAPHGPSSKNAVQRFDAGYPAKWQLRHRAMPEIVADERRRT